MSVPKAKALLTVCAALLLCGCGQALSEREIVRAVFFARQQGAYSACLLLADQNAESDGVQYKTVSARGDTAAQALHLAEDALPGRLYYGLLDLAALPPGCDWADAQTLGTLLYDKAQPAPELSVFVLDTADHSWAADAASLYEDMKAVEREYDLHCGLQQLFAQADGCAVPAYRADSGYDFALLAADGASVYVTGLQAQLDDWRNFLGLHDAPASLLAGGYGIAQTDELDALQQALSSHREEGQARWQGLREAAEQTLPAAQRRELEQTRQRVQWLAERMRRLAATPG